MNLRTNILNINWRETTSVDIIITANAAILGTYELIKDETGWSAQISDELDSALIEKLKNNKLEPLD